MPLKRDIDRFQRTIYNFRNLDDFYSASLESGIYSINYGGRPLEILTEFRQSPTTLIIFHAALSPTVKSTPVFSGLEISKDIYANIICISDPSLDLGLDLAWFAGNSAQPLQRDLPLVIRKILNNFSPNQRIIFFGASGGGFASLFYSYFFPGSIAVPMNPQTNIFKYSETVTLRYLEKGWNISSLNKDFYPFIYDLTNLYKNGFSNHIAYIQNIQDAHHRDNHIAPWMRGIIPNSPRLHIHIDDWGAGHVVPNQSFTHEILKGLVESENFIDFLNSKSFITAPDTNFPAQKFYEWKDSQSLIEN